MMKLSTALCIVLLTTVLSGCTQRSLTPKTPLPHRIALQAPNPAHWHHPEVFTNRFEDWVFGPEGLRVHCRDDLGLRTASLLTCALNDVGEWFQIRIGIDPTDAESVRAGVLLGVGEGELAPDAAMVVQGLAGEGGGILVTVDSRGIARFHEFGPDGFGIDPVELPHVRSANPATVDPPAPLSLEVTARRHDEGVRLVAIVSDATGRRISEVATEEIASDRLRGGVSLAATRANGPPESIVFTSVESAGDRFEIHPDRRFGPIAGVLYSLARTNPDASAELRVGVQLMPVDRPLVVQLETRTPEGWTPLAPPQPADEPSHYVRFVVPNWDITQAAPLRARVLGFDRDTYPFTVRAEPSSDETLAVGTVSCTGMMMRWADEVVPPAPEGYQSLGRWTPHVLWYPHAGITRQLLDMDVDLVFYTGDQIYEFHPTSHRKTNDVRLDYLYKYILWHRAFREVNRSRPVIVQADDHDVYMPNVWGDGGRIMAPGAKPEDGGFLHPAPLTNLFFLTMTGHNPSPWNPGPTSGDLINYFCTFRYGGVDFAVLEDRKFKSAASDQARQTDGQTLLGPSQHAMLEDFAGWKSDRPKIVVSQSIYAGLDVNPRTGQWTENRDQNAWPKQGRDEAVALFARANAIVVAGDQHLATLARLGLAGESPDQVSGPIQFCAPAGGCVHWRWFYPDNSTDNLGGFTDPFGNSVQVLAVGNPGPVEMMNRFGYYPPPAYQAQPGRVHQAEGFGVIRVDPRNQTLTIESHPAEPGAPQHNGWPRTFEFNDLLQRD